MKAKTVAIAVARSGAFALPSSDRAVAELFKGGIAALIASFFGFGLLLAFTPCMFPMLPIVSGMLAPHGTKLTRARGFVLSLAFVLGMSLTYTAAGVAAGLLGSMLSSALQSPWALSLFAGRKAEGNPWGEGATTLEWTLSSPPPYHQFETLPKIA